MKPIVRLCLDGVFAVVAPLANAEDQPGWIDRARTELKNAPIPVLLSVASLDYRGLPLETGDVRGGNGNGNVFFMWAKWRTDGKGASDWARK